MISMCIVETMFVHKAGFIFLPYLLVFEQAGRASFLLTIRNGMLWWDIPIVIEIAALWETSHELIQKIW